MKDKDYNEMTVEELRAEAVKQDIPGRSAMTTRDQLIAGLSGEKETQDADEIGSEDKPKQGVGVNIVGEPKTGKNRTQLYQTAPDTKEHLTKEEAQKKGFYWKEDQHPIR